MKKIIMAALAVILTGLSLCSCNKGSGGLDKRKLERVDETTGTADILLTVSGEQEMLLVDLYNIGDETFTFGDYFKLEVCLDGDWYYVPEETHFAFNEIANVLQPGQRTSRAYDLTFFGDLQSGDYRLSCAGMGMRERVYYAYFTITDSGSYSFAGSNPTGVPAGCIERMQVMYNGTLYVYNDAGVEASPRDGFLIAGYIESIDFRNVPTEDFCATGIGLELGQGIYANPDRSDIILIEFEDNSTWDGYAVFSANG